MPPFQRIPEQQQCRRKEWQFSDASHQPSSSTVAQPETFQSPTKFVAVDAQIPSEQTERKAPWTGRSAECTTGSRTVTVDFADQRWLKVFQFRIS
jgi:hypothetical protein